MNALQRFTQPALAALCLALAACGDSSVATLPAVLPGTPAVPAAPPAAPLPTISVPVLMPNAAAKIEQSKAPCFSAPSGSLKPGSQLSGTSMVQVLPNGFLYAPAGQAVGLKTPRPKSLAVSPDGRYVLTVNAGAIAGLANPPERSIVLIGPLPSTAPTVTVLGISANYFGATFTADSKQFYVSGGDNGNLWVGDVASAKIVGSVNLNPGHPLTKPLDPATGGGFPGAFPSRIALSASGLLYVADQGGYKVRIIDTTLVKTGVDANGAITEPDNFAAYVGDADAGVLPHEVALSADGKRLFVSNVGNLAWHPLAPLKATGTPGERYPYCFPNGGYPDDVVKDRVLRIFKVDARKLPASTYTPGEQGCGYAIGDFMYTIPGHEEPNSDRNASVWVYDLADPKKPKFLKSVKTAALIGEMEDDAPTYAGGHPNAVIATPQAIYVANSNDDSVAVLDAATQKLQSRIPLTLLTGQDARLKGYQPWDMALAPDGKRLYVAEFGFNAVAVIDLALKKTIGHIPVGWSPSGVKISSDGKTLYVTALRGADSGSQLTTDNTRAPNEGTLHIINVPTDSELVAFTAKAKANSGMVDCTAIPDAGANPIPTKTGMRSAQIKHIILVSKENAGFDYLFGTLTATRNGEAVDAAPGYSVGNTYSAPNHYELAQRFGLADNFYIEPYESVEGHRWLTGQYPTQFQESHFQDAFSGGDYKLYPGRYQHNSTATDPQDYNKHGSVYFNLWRHGRSIFNFGMGQEIANDNEDDGLDPTGGSESVSQPMERVLWENSDHYYPQWNLHIPDAPLVKDPTRFSRMGRMKQVFEAKFVDRAADVCKMPDFTSLYLPNDHTGNANNIEKTGPGWSPLRWQQDNDAALGMLVDLISHSPCWKDTVIFVGEDDTLSGVDHTSRFRSPLLVISPWAKAHVSKLHYRMASIFKTIYEIQGVPPLNLLDALATDLRDLFTGTPNFAPYDFIVPQYSEVPAGVPTSAMTPQQLETLGQIERWKAATRDIDFDEPDQDEGRLARAIQTSLGLPRPPLLVPADIEQ